MKAGDRRPGFEKEGWERQRENQFLTEGKLDVNYQEYKIQKPGMHQKKTMNVCKYIMCQNKGGQLKTDVQ